MFNVVESPTGRLHDGPFRSMFAANEAASRANQISREKYLPTRFTVREEKYSQQRAFVAMLAGKNGGAL